MYTKIKLLNRLLNILYILLFIFIGVIIGSFIEQYLLLSRLEYFYVNKIPFVFNGNTYILNEYIINNHNLTIIK